MSLNRLILALAALAPLVVAAWLFTPGGAESQAAPVTGIPCRVSFENTSHGGDWFTVQGEAMLTQTAPQADGSFVAFGTGEATVTFHPGNSCEVTNGDTFKASYMVTMQSDDGRKAQVDFASEDESHTFDLLCPGLIRGRGASKLAKTSSDYDPPGWPTVTVELREGATTYSHDQTVRTPAGVQHVGDMGSVTLHYCTPEQPNGR
jgi:hypothetical protein